MLGSKKHAQRVFDVLTEGVPEFRPAQVMVAVQMSTIPAVTLAERWPVQPSAWFTHRGQWWSGTAVDSHTSLHLPQPPEAVGILATADPYHVACVVMFSDMASLVALAHTDTADLLEARMAQLHDLDATGAARVIGSLRVVERFFCEMAAGKWPKASTEARDLAQSGLDIIYERRRRFPTEGLSTKLPADRVTAPPEELTFDRLPEYVAVDKIELAFDREFKVLARAFSGFGLERVTWAAGDYALTFTLDAGLKAPVFFVKDDAWFMQSYTLDSHDADELFILEKVTSESPPFWAAITIAAEYAWLLRIVAFPDTGDAEHLRILQALRPTSKQARTARESFTRIRQFCDGFVEQNQGDAETHEYACGIWSELESVIGT